MIRFILDGRMVDKVRGMPPKTISRMHRGFPPFFLARVVLWQFIIFDHFKPRNKIDH